MQIQIPREILTPDVSKDPTRKAIGALIQPFVPRSPAEINSQIEYMDLSPDSPYHYAPESILQELSIRISRQIEANPKGLEYLPVSVIFLNPETDEQLRPIQLVIVRNDAVERVQLAINKLNGQIQIEDGPVNESRWVRIIDCSYHEAMRSN